ncbi:MAG TPA: branched-chain amino acid ABC transporter substrate-binding protein [Mycobacteriales bacterium]|nr:branched-chain amino acid ABC transporter substrate-binding protein [Mycobacteriales bacterium]
MAAAAASALFLSACGGDDSSSSDSGSSGGGGGSVTLGFMGAQTGPNAQLGINISNGVELALAQHNAKSGVTQVKLIKYDTQGDPTQATNQAKKAITDKVVGVVGPAFSGESKTAVPILDEAGIPNVSPSATAVSLAASGWKTWHRVLANDDVQGPGDADFMAKTLGAKNVAVIDDQSEYGKGLADAVRKQLATDSVKVAVNDSIDPNASSYSSTVNKVKPANVDAIFFGGYYSAAGKLIKQLRDGGVQGSFMSGDGSLDAQVISAAGGTAADGVLLSCTCSSAVGSTDPAVQKFATDYKAKYNVDPATYSAEGFDATNAFLQAIDAGKTSTSDINDFVTKIDFKGVSKQIKFTDSGELSGNLLFITEVKDGKLSFLGDTATAKPTA